MHARFTLLASTAVGAKAEEVVSHLLLEILVIMVITRVVVIAARRFLGQTDVAGEILAGLVLGPSLLGAFAPDLMGRLFHPSTSEIFVGIAQVGLIFLMFQIGLEFEFRANLADSKRSIVAISAAGLAVPFALGYAAAPWFWGQIAEPRPPELGFRLFFAIAMSITAIPILGRIFMELDLSHTRTAALTIGAAAIDDVAGWILLGVASAIVTTQFALAPILLRLGALLLYVGLVFFVVRRPIQRAVAAHIRREGRLGNQAIVLLVIMLFTSALITSRLGAFAIIGGFVVGVALHDDRRFVDEWKSRIGPMVQTLFLPLFFAYTGLRTDVGTLGTAEARVQCLLVCAIAFVGKFGGAYAAARLVGERHRSALTIGVCMNTRGLMELIALNVGYDLGVLPRQMFTMLIIMAIASTFIATPLIRLLMSAERRKAPDRRLPGGPRSPRPACGGARDGRRWGTHLPSRS